MRTRDDPQRFRGWSANRCSTHNWAHFPSLLFLLGFEGTSFSWIWPHTFFAFEALQALFRIYFKVLFSLVNALFCMQVLVWHFGLILRYDCFSWSWLAFVPFLQEQEFLHWNCANSAFGKGAVLWKLPVKAFGLVSIESATTFIMGKISNWYWQNSLHISHQDSNRPLETSSQN